MNLLKKYFLPTSYVENIKAITPERLKNMGVNTVMTDLDNTLVAFDEPDADNEVVEWFSNLKENGINVMILSNGKSGRVGTFCEPNGFQYICSARKPLSKNFRRAVKEMNADIESTVMVGDQLMTDIFGANRVNMKSILVIPVKDKDGLATILNRRMERMIMRYFNERGLLSKED